jgi:hypothetical protein
MPLDNSHPPQEGARRTPRSKEERRPQPAPIGPNGQPLLVRQGSHGRGLVVGLALVIGLLGLWLVQTARSVADNPEAIRTDQSLLQIFPDEKELAKRIERDGPRLYPGVGTTIDTWVTRVSDQWVAFAARPAGAPRSCNAVWRPDIGQFADGCDAAKLYGASGAGLKQYEVITEDGAVSVRLTK